MKRSALILAALAALAWPVLAQEGTPDAGTGQAGVASVEAQDAGAENAVKTPL